MTENIVLRVAQKELRLFFASPVAWFFLGSFSAVTLFIFFWVEAFFARNIADVRPLFEWLPLLLIFLAAALTMRMWSEERRGGTLEHVLTQPVPLWQFVAGKFLACVTLLLLALVTTLPLPLTVAWLGNLDWGPVLAGYLATALLGAAYLSIGLFVSARTDNAMVSLMGSVLLAGLLYMLGSPLLTGFFGDGVGGVLRLLGSGSRFDSITRGVIDARDLYYYLAVCGVFLVLNVYTLESERWAAGGHPRHRRWRIATGLLVANLLLGAVWLQRLPMLRADVTEGQLYSISAPTHDVLAQLQEPLLIRGYFSERTHPLLAPLVPQLKDLLREYAIAGGDRVRVEFVDPAREPAKEQEANEEYGINAKPFQVADRYQSALVNAYFDVLVQYGGEHETLSFGDLIEVKTGTGGQPEVVLRNPEFDVTRAVRDVLYAYQAGGNLFEQVAAPITFTAYVSRDALLPQLLRDYRDAIRTVLDEQVARSGGKFRVEFLEPEAGDGAVAERIIEEWGFQPMLASLDDPREFFFYLTLEDDHQVVQLPTGNFDPGSFPDSLEAGIKRFASGFTKTVALVLPDSGPRFPGMPPSGHSFDTFEQGVTREYSILREDLSDGSVAPSADLLVLVAPEDLDERAVFAVDQYLMRGGTVIVASSNFSVELTGDRLRMREVDSGLRDWLETQGIRIADTLVLDRQHGAFPVPVVRRIGGYEFRDMQFVDYPYFLDLREPGLNGEHPVTAGLPNLTLAWASPVAAEGTEARTVTPLLVSSPESWRSDARDVMPDVDPAGGDVLAPGGAPLAPETVGVLVQGRFESAFEEVPPAPEPAAAGEETAAADGDFGGLLRRSPASARLLVIGSNDFTSDQVLSGLVAASGTQYLSPVELLLGAVDWALADGSLLEIRSRAHFNRTLPPLEEGAQARIEYLNYGLALALLGLIALAHQLRQRQRRNRYRRVLA